MWYAIMDIRNEVDAMTWLTYGTLRDIADAVLEQCGNCNPDGSGTLDFESFDEEGFYYEADAYSALDEAKSVTPDLLKGFYFTLSGAEVSVHCLAEGYSAFRKAFEEYDGLDFWLEELCLPETLAPEEEEAFAEELADILFENEQFGELSEDRKYVTQKRNDEEDE